MGALAYAVGVTVKDETTFEQRIDYSTERMMEDTVPERCRRNDAVPWVEHLDLDVTAGFP